MYKRPQSELGATEVAAEPSFWDALVSKTQQAITTGFKIYGKYEQLQNVQKLREQTERARQETTALIQAQQQAEMMQAQARQQQMATGGGFNLGEWMLPIGIGAAGLVMVMMMRGKRR